MTPNIAIVHLQNPHRKGCRLYLPLFLLWIPLLLLSPLLLLFLLAYCFLGRIGFGVSVAVCWAILCGLPGTDVQVEARHSRILVEIL